MINTLGEKLENVFFVLDEHGQEIDDLEQRKMIRAAVLENID